MGRRSAIASLPDDIRRQIDERLVAGGFADYAGLAEWLASIGVQISRSAIHRHGQQLEAQYQDAMADARGLLALTRAAGDIGESGSELARSAATLLQTDIVRTVLDIRKTDDPGQRADLLAKLARAQAQVGRMSVAAEKWADEARQRAAAAADNVDELAKRGGLSADAAAEIRKQILGIV